MVSEKALTGYSKSDTNQVQKDKDKLRPTKKEKVFYFFFVFRYPSTH